MGRSGPGVNRNFDQSLVFVPAARPAPVIPLVSPGAAMEAQAQNDPFSQRPDEGSAAAAPSSRLLDYLQREYITTRDHLTAPPVTRSPGRGPGSADRDH
jgi:hypothetical protein